MGFTMSHSILLASNSYTADKTELHKFLACSEFLLVAAVYVISSLQNWLSDLE